VSGVCGDETVGGGGEGGGRVKLHLHVKTCYFDAIKAGTKSHEYRLAKKYWNERLHARDYDGIVLYNAYKPGAENRIEMPWLTPHTERRTHPHFGPDEVLVWAIPMTVTP
jgi:hypothetical protein